MIAKYYGKAYSSQTLRQRSFITREGVSMLGISDAAESIGMRTMGVKTTFEQLEKEHVTPFIAHRRQVHFVLKHIEQELTNYGFIRINRNTIVNMKYINKINYRSRTVILQKNDVLIQISRRKLFEIKKNNRTILPLIC